MKTVTKFLSAMFLFCAMGMSAQVPNKMSYQAVVRNASNALVANAPVGVRISILQNTASGTEVYKEKFTPNPTTNANGLMTLEIGTGTPITGTFAAINWATGPYFVKTEIDPLGGTSYTVTATSQLASVPYALHALTASSVASVSGTPNAITKFTAANTVGNSQIVDDGTNVSINLGDNPVSGKLDIRTLPADNNSAIYGFSKSAASCLKGGISGSYDGANYGTGIQGVGYNGIAYADVNTNFTTGNQDIGVYGSANTVGVEGTSVNGIGVVGYNKNSSFAATTGGGNSYGVYGYANTIGGATVPTTRYGVYGYATGAATNYAGYFSGNVQISGSISKGSGTFKIDHPLDPANKYLYHSFVESPDMINIYNGNVTTDASGVATVSLPDYFEALNENFKYQLTVIDENNFAQARISKKIANNRFAIKTDKPNIQVSWQVTGVRHDKYAQAHRVVPEVEKEPELKGKFLHAKEWGKSDADSIDSVTRPKESSEGRK